MSDHMGGKVITFYSYKGGTGRSMALANVAWVLASNGKRVLVIDWDLEAPGLHRYFHPFLEDKALTSTEGLIDFVVDFAAEAMSPLEQPEVQPPSDWYMAYADLQQYAVALDWDFDNKGLLALVPAGRQGPRYAPRVNAFNWRNFYDRLGGHAFLEAAKEQLRASYDYILVDSRTGVSDTAGICTVQFPDTVVVCFTLNTQSIEGAFAAADSMDEQRRNADGTPALRIFPVPMRVETGEKDRLQAARRLSREKFARFLWHLSPQEREEYWSQVEIFYEEYYAYEEILATFADRPHDARNSLLGSVEQLTAYLTQREIKKLRPPPETTRQAVLSQYLRKLPEVRPVSTEAPPVYWFYLACSAVDYREQVEEFFRDVSNELRGLLGTSVEVGLLDASTANTPERARQVELALASSRVFVPLYSPSFFNSAEEGRKFQYFLERANASGTASEKGYSPVLPVQWLPVDAQRLPERAAHFTGLERGLSEIYQRLGLLELMRRKDLRDDYLEFLAHFSKQLLETAKAHPLGVLPGLALPAEQPNAFQEPLQGGVFLSYASMDRDAIRHIRHQLEARGVTGLIDPAEHLPPGAAWQSSLSKLLATVSAAIVFVGRELSPWQRHELSILTWRQGGEGSNATFRLIPMLLPGVLPEELPGSLLLNTWVDLRKDEAAGLDLLAKALRTPPPAPVAPRLPSHPGWQEAYRGLLPFREEDAPLFFGREDSARALQNAVRTYTWVTLVGPSGSGKTSLVQAGLLPSLRQQPSTAVVLFKPGARPFHALAEALLLLLDDPTSPAEHRLRKDTSVGDTLASTHKLVPTLSTLLSNGNYDQLVLIIDQLEDCFARVSPVERDGFLLMLRRSQQAAPLKILAVLRADFFGQLISSQSLRNMEAGGTVLLGGMSSEELRRAIERPAELLGVRFEAGLVERVIADTQDEPGSLPLLQFTLSQLWRTRNGDVLNHSGYMELGGTMGALTRSAEQFYGGLSREDQERARELFRSLVIVQSDKERRVALLTSRSWDQLDPASQRVAELLIRERLLIRTQPPGGEPSLEAAHETLFTRWRRLTPLLEEARPAGPNGIRPFRPMLPKPWSLRLMALLIAAFVIGTSVSSFFLQASTVQPQPPRVQEDACTAAGWLTASDSMEAVRRWIDSIIIARTSEAALETLGCINEPGIKLEAAFALAEGLNAAGHHAQAIKALEPALVLVKSEHAADRAELLARRSAVHAAAGDETTARNLGLEAFESVSSLRLDERAAALNAVTRNLKTTSLEDPALRSSAMRAITKALDEARPRGNDINQELDTFRALVSALARLDAEAASKLLLEFPFPKLRVYPGQEAEMWLSLLEAVPPSQDPEVHSEALLRMMSTMEKSEGPGISLWFYLTALHILQRDQAPVPPALLTAALTSARERRDLTAILEIAKVHLEAGRSEEAMSLTREVLSAGPTLEAADAYAQALASAAPLLIQLAPAEFDPEKIQRFGSLGNRNLVRANAARAYADQNQLQTAVALARDIRDVDLHSLVQSAIARAQARLGTHLTAYETASKCVFPEDRLNAYSSILFEMWRAQNSTATPAIPWTEPK